jgi:hypothetical protein
MHIPIPDMKIDSHGISGTLSFKGRPFKVHSPWGSIFAVVGTNGKGFQWAEDTPTDLPKVQNEPAELPPVKKKSPSLRLVKPSHLRLVK